MRAGSTRCWSRSLPRMRIALRLRRAIAIVEARLQEMEQWLSQISESQTETPKAIGEAIITASAAYVAERLKDVGADLRSGELEAIFRAHTSGNPYGTHKICCGEKLASKSLILLASPTGFEPVTPRLGNRLPMLDLTLACGRSLSQNLLPQALLLGRV